MVKGSNTGAGQNIKKWKLKKKIKSVDFIWLAEQLLLKQRNKCGILAIIISEKFLINCLLNGYFPLLPPQRTIARPYGAHFVQASSFQAILNMVSWQKKYLVENCSLCSILVSGFSVRS